MLFVTLPHAMNCEETSPDHCHQTAKKKSKKDDCRSCCQTLLQLPNNLMTISIPESVKQPPHFFYFNLYKKIYTEPDLKPPIT